MSKNFSHRSSAGVTLMEILLAMVILGLVTGGVFSAFVFSRRVTNRSQAQTLIQNYMVQLNEQLRRAMAGDIAAGPFQGLTLNPGVYVDENMVRIPPLATRLAALNLPPDLRIYQNRPGTADDWTGYGDGVILVVEELADLDGDGLTGQDFDGDRIVDLRRATIRIRWNPPPQN